ncbi:MAG: hypothetical protein LBD20_05235, partial [Spirochaetaceae bacterium]|nr:hypothetical protein [Spirochaetaceae bacterium]
MANTTYYYAVKAWSSNFSRHSELSAYKSAVTSASAGAVLTWTHTGNLPVGMYGHKAAVKDGKIIVSIENKVFVSHNGSSWTEYLAFPDPVYMADHQYIHLNNKLWTVGGLTVNGGYFDSSRAVFSSTNGSVWTQASAVSGLTDGISRHTALSFDNAAWVIGGQTTSGMDNLQTTNKVWKSTDGANWTSYTPNGLSARAGAAGVVYNGYMWITGGCMTGGMQEYRDVLRSTNGTSWTTVTSAPAWVKRNSHSLAANTTGMYLIGGNGGPDGSFLNDVWFSTNGAAWTEKTNAPFPPRA